MAQRVLIYSAVSEHAHACQAATELSVEAFSEYRHMLMGDLRHAGHPAAAASPASQGGGGHASQGGEVGSGALSIKVTGFPLLACALDPGLFVLPANAAAGMAR